MCPNHHTNFDQYQFFIRYDFVVGLSPLVFGRLDQSIHCKQNRVFVLINYSGRRALKAFHGKAIAIDIDDQYAPFPSIFIIHEMRVRGHHPFQPIHPDLPNIITWQDWITSGDDLLLDTPNPTNEIFRRDPPSDDDDENGGGGNGGGGNGGADTDDANNNQRNLPRRSGRSARQQGTMTGTSSGTRKLEFTTGVIADILAATHAMPSWKACQMENTSWSGTADENIRRYVSSIGVETSLSSNTAEC
jgi:hypothetical protein